MKYFIGWSEEEGARLFSVVLTDRARGNGHTLKHKKTQNSFYCEGDVTLDQVSQKGCGVPILGDIQNLTRHGPGQAAFAGPV